MTTQPQDAREQARALLAGSDAVLVDLDGTLLDSQVAVRTVCGMFARRHGLSEDEVYSFVYGRLPREAIPVLLPDGDHATEIAAFDEAELRQADAGGIEALPGAHALLADGGRPLALVTSCSHALATARLRAAGLTAPAVMVTADCVLHGKPDPECFLLGAQMLGVDPTRCVVFEDSPAGIAAGRAAGACVVALRTTRPEAELHDAHAIVDTLASVLPAALNGD
jgi:mannitol-1-/sugar-/sorbitol-6-phosphatase